MKKPTVRPGTYCVLLLLLVTATPASAGSDFVAWGNGTATVTGTGSVDFTCQGFFIVCSNAQVTLCGSSAVPAVLPDGRLLYSQFSGTVTVTGEAFEVTCGGIIPWLRGSFRGTAFIKGFGYYKQGFQQGLWRSDGATITIAEPADQ
jgi:hypothetical protein